MTSRKTFAFALGLLALAPGRAPAQEDPALADAVRAYASGMSLATDPALVHAADFTGDGRPDVAAVLEGSGRSALVIFNRTDRGYQTHPLYANLPEGPWDIRVVGPGRHRVLGTEGTLELTSPAIELVFPGRSSAIYAWRGNRYQVFGTENYH
jgi:hypothetical protein